MKESASNTTSTLQQLRSVVHMYFKKHPQIHEKQLSFFPFESGFLGLPKDLIMFIEFFIDREDWKNLMNASKSFRFVYRETRFLDLNRWNSIKFFYQLDFQQYILQQCISNPSRQLSLTYENNLNINDSFFQYFQQESIQLKQLILKNCSKLISINILSCVKHLIVEKCENLEKIAFDVHSLEKLEIYSCEKFGKDLTNFEFIPSLTMMDISPRTNYSSLGAHQYLKIGNDVPVTAVVPPITIPSNYDYLMYDMNTDDESDDDEDENNMSAVVPFTPNNNSSSSSSLRQRRDAPKEKLSLPSVAPFRSVYSLDLSNISGFRNVSVLKYVHSLNLSNCIQIKNVSALGNVVELNLSGCVELIDISGLGKRNKIINLSNCYKIVKVNHLANCEEIQLANCLGVTDVSGLSRVKRLNLSGCINILDVNMLTHVEELNLSENIQLTDISGLGRPENTNYRLNLSYCKNISSFASLENVHALNLSYCNVSSIHESYEQLKRHVPELILSEDFCRSMIRLEQQRQQQRMLQAHLQKKLKPTVPSFSFDSLLSMKPSFQLTWKSSSAASSSSASLVSSGNSSENTSADSSPRSLRSNRSNAPAEQKSSRFPTFRRRKVKIFVEDSGDHSYHLPTYQV